MPPDAAASSSTSFVERLESHLRWQRKQRQSADSTHRFLVYRPGNRWVICAPGPIRRKLPNKLPGCQMVKKEYQQSHVPPYTGHWDDAIDQFASSSPTLRPGNYSRAHAAPGLGNIMSGLVSAAAVAMFSKRILLVENWTTVSHSLDWPLSQLVLESSGFERSVLQAQHEGSRVDSFMAEDDFSIADHFCSNDLRQEPSARVWRLFSDQYFLPLLFLNQHHRGELAAMGVSQGPDVSPIWGPALRFFLRPLPALMQGVNAFESAHFPPAPRGGGPQSVIAIHVRCVMSDGRCNNRQLAQAADCARQRVVARNASRVFVAAMHQSHRDRLAQDLRGVANVFWYGDAVHGQALTDAQEDARLADLMLLAKADEVLIAQTSSFGYMVRGLASGTPARFYASCVDVPSGATEPNLQIVDDVLRNCKVCRRLNTTMRDATGAGILVRPRGDAGRLGSVRIGA